MRLVPLALGLALAACSSPIFSPPAPEADPSEPLPGGLSHSQADQLRDLGLPVLVPGDPGDFRLTVFEVTKSAASARYRIDYQRTDGACFQVSGSTDGLGGPAYPLVSTDVQIASVPGQPVVRVYQAADDPAATSAQVWGVRAVVSEYVSMDGMSVHLLSDTVDGCAPVSLEEGAAIVAGLRMIAAGPASGAVVSAESDLGPFAPATDLTDRYNAASSPEVAAEAVAARYDGEADDVAISVLSETDTEAVVLVTVEGLRDDSVRDERLRLTYVRDGFGTWELVDAGRQVRCWPNRGHAAWGAEPCL